MTCSPCGNNECCKLLLNLNNRIYQLYIACPPATLETPVTLSYLLTTWLGPTINVIYPKTKCGQVFCCEGLVESIYTAFQVAMSALTTADEATAPGIFANLAATLTAILTQAGFVPPTYPVYPPPP